MQARYSVTRIPCRRCRATRRRSAAAAAASSPSSPSASIQCSQWIYDTLSYLTHVSQSKCIYLRLLHHHHHLSLNREGRWGTTDDFANSFLQFSPVLHCPLGPAELQACPCPDVVFPPLPLSALSSPPFYCALELFFVTSIPNASQKSDRC